jgi:hypothetical protein
MLISLKINSYISDKEIIDSLYQYVENPYSLLINNKQKGEKKYKNRTLEIEKNLYELLKRINPRYRIELIIEAIINNYKNELWYGSLLFKDKNLWIREKITPVGKIDGLNLKEKRIVELKFISGWKSALGQIISYGHFYPTFQKEIWLLEDKKISEKDKNLIREICGNFSVLVEFIPV